MRQEKIFGPIIVKSQLPKENQTMGPKKAKAILEAIIFSAAPLPVANLLVIGKPAQTELLWQSWREYQCAGRGIQLSFIGRWI